jgi:hypothetical protein
VTNAASRSELDAARAAVVARGLMPAAVAALTETVKGLPLDALAPVKQSLKRFFSDEPWSEHDRAALADTVGPGSGMHALALDPEIMLEWGWEDERFFLRVKSDGSERDFGDTFDSDVYPEVTPNPRTIRFATPPLHDGASRVYESIGAAAGDARVARIFRDFDVVTNVLVGPAFVAVSISHPDRWESILQPMLQAITEEFTGPGADDATASTSSGSTGSASASVTEAAPDRTPKRLERAWTELGALRADRPDDLERVIAASRDADAARRQVATALLADAPPAVAAEAWGRLFGDDSRSVRRSVIDAVVDADREALRPLLERALGDPDAWTRWKAVHGLAALGAEPSRNSIEALANDPDFRVRLEATRALR